LVVADATDLPVPADGFVLPDSGDQTWAKIGLPDTAWPQLVSLLPTLDPVARVVVWNALILAVADAEVDPALAVEIVAAAVPVEENEILLRDMLAWTTGPLCRAYLAAPADALDTLTSAADAALAAAAPGSGRQLAALRGVVAASSDVARLQRLRAGEAPDGVALDPDLRWRLVARLTALGALDLADIGAELVADESAEGGEHAAQCRALVPSEDAKAMAWERLMRDTECSAALLYATASGFWHPAQRAITKPFGARYFAEIVDTGRLRSGWVVGRVAGLAYPAIAVSQTTLDLADALLARDDVPVSIARAVVDCTDDLRRAVASRARFG
jgi:aminopeptidase N